MPISWKGKLAQYTGRLHRRYEGKKQVIVYDYIDINVGILEGMYHKRVAGYRSIGYDISLAEKGRKSGILFDKFNYLQVFNEDMMSAQKNIIISCPHLRQKHVLNFISMLESPSTMPEITVITRNHERLSEGRNAAETLVKAGINVKLKDDLHSKFAVIDNSLVWYGSIAFLNYSLAEDTALRFTDATVANELLSNLGD